MGIMNDKEEYKWSLAEYGEPVEGEIVDAPAHHELCEVGIDLRAGRQAVYADCDCERQYELDRVIAHIEHQEYMLDVIREASI